MRNDAVQDHFLHGSPVGDAGSNPLGLVLATTQKKAVAAGARPFIVHPATKQQQQQHCRLQYNAVAQPQPDGGGGAFIFHRMLTEGPENTSRVVGKAQSFIIPAEHFAKSGFNIIYLTFYTPQFSGSLSVEAKHVSRQDTEELTVMGGTGSFAFARGVSVFAKTTDEDGHVDQQSSSGNVVDYATYHVKLQLRFPNQSQTVLG